MVMRDLVTAWFQSWESGRFRDIPVTPEFVHVSPFGSVDGRDAYLSLVEANVDAFLGFTFQIHDAMFDDERACVRYTATRDGNDLEAAEWFYGSPDGITKIISYYNVGDASYPEMAPDDS